MHSSKEHQISLTYLINSNYCQKSKEYARYLKLSVFLIDTHNITFYEIMLLIVSFQ